MAQCLDQRLVGFCQVDIFADHADGDHMLRIFQRGHQFRPYRQIGRRQTRQAQVITNDTIQALLVQHLRNLVDAVHIPHRDHRFFADIGKQRNLGAFIFGDAPVGPADQSSGENTDLAQFLHTVLCRLGLQLACCGDVGNQGEMHISDLVAPHAQAHLPGSLEKRQRLDIADRAADLDDRNIGLAVMRSGCAALDEKLYLVGDVRDHLDRLAQIFAPPLLADHAVVDLPGREVVGLAHLRGNEALVMPQIQIGFRTVFRHKNLAMLKRAHGAGIDVDIGIQLQHRHLQTARFQNGRK